VLRVVVHDVPRSGTLQRPRLHQGVGGRVALRDLRPDAHDDAGRQSGWAAAAAVCGYHRVLPSAERLSGWGRGAARQRRGNAGREDRASQEEIQFKERPMTKLTRIRWGAAACLAAGAAVALSISAAARQPSSVQPGTENGEWRYWGGDAGNTRYAPLDQINAENFNKLQVAWVWRGDNYGPSPDNILRS